MASTVERGYGAEHRRTAAAMARLVEAGEAVCVRCGQVIVAGKIRRRDGKLVRNWVPDHTGDRTGYLGPAHLRCNARAAARVAAARRRGRRMRSASPPVLPWSW